MALSSTNTYRRLHSGIPGDIDFYRRTCEGAARVLELGCGWGRITRHLSRTAKSVVGLDQEGAFLEEARDTIQGATFIAGDMASFALPQLYDRIVIPYNAVYCLGGSEGLLSCLQCVKRHLAPTGELWFDCYPCDDFHAAALSEEIPPDDEEPVLSFFEAGEHYDVLESTEIDVHAQLLTVTYTVVNRAKTIVLETTLEHHYLLLPQITQALDQAGLSLLVIAGSFSGAPPDEDPEQIIVGAGHDN